MLYNRHKRGQRSSVTCAYFFKPYLDFSTSLRLIRDDSVMCILVDYLGSLKKACIQSHTGTKQYRLLRTQDHDTDNSLLFC
jgi:hypothetical protein